MDLSLSQWGLSWLAGSLSILSPCVLPLLPMVLGGVMQGSRWGPLAMGAGMAITFAAMGVLLGALGPATGLDSEQLRLSGGALLMVLGALMWVPRWNERLTQWMAPLASGANALSAHLHGHTAGSALLLGGLLGVVWSPCSGPLLASALIMAGTEGGAWPGGVLLGFFGLGAATPLIALAYVSRQSVQRIRERMANHEDPARKLMGGVIFLTGLAVVSGADKWLEARVLVMLPVQWLQKITLY